jgi:hypothetical protein
VPLKQGRTGAISGERNGWQTRDIAIIAVSYKALRFKPFVKSCGPEGPKRGNRLSRVDLRPQCQKN